MTLNRRNSEEHNFFNQFEYFEHKMQERDYGKGKGGFFKMFKIREHFILKNVIKNSNRQQHFMQTISHANFVASNSNSKVVVSSSNSNRSRGYAGPGYKINNIKNRICILLIVIFYNLTPL